MTNNDILIRLRYALDLKDAEMVKIFGMGDMAVTVDEVQKILTKPKDFDMDGHPVQDEQFVPCDNVMLESFLNGLIIYKRGRQEPKPGQPDKPPMMITGNASVNNVLLKKLRIALSLTSEDMLEILGEAGVTINKSELSALLRKEGHSNYRICGDRYARNFLKGLGLRFRSR